MQCTICNLACGSSLCVSCQNILKTSLETACDKTHSTATNWRKAATIALLSELKANPEIALLIQQAELSAQHSSPQENDNCFLLLFHFESLQHPNPALIRLPEKAWLHAYDHGNATILCYTAASIFRDYAFQLQSIDNINGFFDGIYRYCLAEIAGLAEFTESKYTSLFILQKAYIDVLHARGFQQEAIHHFRRLIGSIHAFRSEHSFGYTFDFHGLGTRTAYYATIYAVTDLILNHPLDRSVRFVTGQHGDGAVKQGVAEACALLGLPFSLEQDNRGAFIVTKKDLASSSQRVRSRQQAVEIQIARQAEQEALEKQEESARNQLINSENEVLTLLIEETNARQDITFDKTADRILIAALFAVVSTWKEQAHGALLIQQCIQSFHTQLAQNEAARLSLLDTAANAKIAFADQHLEDLSARHAALDNTLQQIAYRNRGEQTAVFTPEREARRALLSSEDNTFQTLLMNAVLSHHSAAMLAEKREQLLLAHAAYRLILAATPSRRAIFEDQESRMLKRYFSTLFHHAKQKKAEKESAMSKKRVVALQMCAQRQQQNLEDEILKSLELYMLAGILCFLFQSLLILEKENKPDYIAHALLKLGEFSAITTIVITGVLNLTAVVSSFFIEQDKPIINDASAASTPTLGR